VTVVANQKFDATGATWTGKLSYAVWVGNNLANNICWHGGRIVGTWDQATTQWEVYHDTGALVFVGPNSIWEDLYVENYGDAIRAGPGGFSTTDTLTQNWTMRRIHVVDMHDDCVENDRQWEGLIDDSFFEGCFVLVSTRPAGGWTGDGRNNTVTIQNSLLWHKAFFFPEGCRLATATPPCTGPTWKWDNRSGMPGPKLALKNTIIRIDQHPSQGVLNMPPQTTCENTVIVWLGSGEYPAPVPAGCTVTTDVGVWDRAVSDWEARHP
jgi:hypothetical protein